MIDPFVEQQRGLMDDLERRAASGALRVDIDKPVLLVWGRGDPVFPLEQGERLAHYAGPHARLVIIEDAAHAPNLEHPEAFERAVAPFLAE